MEKQHVVGLVSVQTSAGIKAKESETGADIESEINKEHEQLLLDKSALGYWVLLIMFQHISTRYVSCLFPWLFRCGILAHCLRWIAKSPSETGFITKATTSTRHLLSLALSLIKEAIIDFLYVQSFSFFSLENAGINCPCLPHLLDFERLPDEASVLSWICKGTKKCRTSLTKPENALGRTFVSKLPSSFSFADLWPCLADFLFLRFLFRAWGLFRRIGRLFRRFRRLLSQELWLGLLLPMKGLQKNKGSEGVV